MEVIETVNEYGETEITRRPSASLKNYIVDVDGGGSNQNNGGGLVDVNLTHEKYTKIH